MVTCPTVSGLLDRRRSPGARRTAWIALALVVSAMPAAADDPETMAMRRVRLTTDPATVKGCARIGGVSDDSVKDLRKKIVRAGGDAAVLTFGITDMELIHAEVFRCPAPAAPAQPKAPPKPLPPGVPPPPAGTPPPPPPGPSR